MLRVRARHRGDTRRGERLSGEDPDFPEEGRTQQAKSPGGIPEADRGPRVVGPDHGSQPKEGHPDPNMQDTSAVGQGARKEETGGSKTSDRTSKTSDLRHLSGERPGEIPGHPASVDQGKTPSGNQGRISPQNQGRMDPRNQGNPGPEDQRHPASEDPRESCLPSICS